MRLEEIGWDDGWELAFADCRARHWLPGRVAVEDKHSYGVLTEAGPLTAKVSGRLLHQCRIRATLPKVGDWVALAAGANPDTACIHATLPRRTQLARNDTGRPEREQVLAVNVDTAFVVQALDQSFESHRLERCLALVHAGGVQPVVVLNKTDLCPSVPTLRAQAQTAAGEDVPVLCVSARQTRSLRSLLPHLLPGRTVVFIGPSGAGKSSLINSLYGEEVQATLEVRAHDAKGRHSTTWRELIRLPGGGLVIDTPGLREFQVDLDADGLADMFPDLAELAVRCHFRNCSHTVESRCAVLAALAAGAVPRERFERFQKRRREHEYLAAERRKHTYARKRTVRPARD
jgi:ribosome biogenesis GTPase / thiamine phosphate phosphatase